jgi:hypothetical protein
MPVNFHQQDKSYFTCNDRYFTTLGHALTLVTANLIDLKPTAILNVLAFISARVLFLTGPSFSRPEYVPVILVLSLTPGLFCRDGNIPLNRMVLEGRYGPGRKVESLASNIWINCLDRVSISDWSW